LADRAWNRRLTVLVVAIVLAFLIVGTILALSLWAISQDPS
jgi:hypothetical protein